MAELICKITLTLCKITRADWLLNSPMFYERYIPSGQISFGGKIFELILNVILEELNFYHEKFQVIKYGGTLSLLLFKSDCIEEVKSNEVPSIATVWTNFNRLSFRRPRHHQKTQLYKELFTRAISLVIFLIMKHVIEQTTHQSIAPYSCAHVMKRMNMLDAVKQIEARVMR